MKKACLALVAAAALSTTGCYAHEYYVTGTTPEPTPAVWSWNHYLFWGLLGISRDYALDQVCPQGIARVESWIGPLQAILSILTAGIYTPTTVRIFCKVGGHSDLRLHLDRRVVERMRRRFPHLEVQIRRALAHPEEPPVLPPASVGRMRVASGPPAHSRL